MPARLPIFIEQPAHSYTIALDGVQYEVGLVYRARTSSWYLDLREVDGAVLLRGRRLSPGWSPQAGIIAGGPPGVLVVFGVDPYARDGIELWYYSSAELEAVPAAEGELLPVVLG